jgi:hypothetical protein
MHFLPWLCLMLLFNEVDDLKDHLWVSLEILRLRHTKIFPRRVVCVQNVLNFVITCYFETLHIQNLVTLFATRAHYFSGFKFKFFTNFFGKVVIRIVVPGCIAKILCNSVNASDIFLDTHLEQLIAIRVISTPAAANYMLHLFTQPRLDSVGTDQLFLTALGLWAPHGSMLFWLVPAAIDTVEFFCYSFFVSVDLF